MNHQFWQNNQPGNIWNCKCDWKTTDAPASAEPDKIVQPAKGLEGNPFETGELITQKHPYFKNAPERISRNALLQLPDELAFEEVETEYGSYLEHLLVQSAKETDSNRKIVKILLKEGFKDLKLLPTIYHSEITLRERYYGETFSKLNKTKCPDCVFGDLLVEFKSSEGGLYSIREGLKDAAKQADIAVIKIQDPPDNSILENLIMGALNKYKNLEKVFIFNDDGRLIMTKAK